MILVVHVEVKQSMDENGILIKSSEGAVGASDKAPRGIRSRRDLPMVKIARRRTHVDIRALV